MDSSLLAVLRYLGRNCPPCYDQPGPQKLLLMWAVFKDLVAVSCAPMNFIVDYDVGAIVMASDSHKTREVRSFIASLLDQARFSTITYRKRIPLFSFLVAQLFLRRRFGKFLGNYSWIRRRYPARISRDFLKFFLYQAIAERCFSNRPPAALAIVSDLGARRIAFARAAQKSGAAIIYYQYVPHHNFRPPFHVDHGICINNLLAERLKQNADSTVINRVVFKGVPEDLKFQPVPKDPVVGIATNVFPHSTSINEAAAQLREQFGGMRILYKPHPRNTDHDIHDIQCEIFDKDASAEAFAERIDLCICGDTTTVLRVLLCGTPCLYLPSLDGRRRDRYGYVKGAAVLGAEAVEDVSVEDINGFYCASESLGKIQHYMKENMTIDETKDETQEFVRCMNKILDYK